MRAAADMNWESRTRRMRQSDDVIAAVFHSTELFHAGRIKTMLTIVLLFFSNMFMTFAWYGHLKHRSAPLIEAIVISWLIAFGEYCLQVPANRIGYGEFTAFQLKIIQECITLIVFVIFAYFYLGEAVRWNYALSFVCIIAAVVFAFWR
jgi:uncharacterized protein (DUF486 family)